MILHTIVVHDLFKSLVGRIWMILHTSVVHDPVGCQNFVSRSNPKGNSAHIAKSYVLAITFYGKLTGNLDFDDNRGQF